VSGVERVEFAQRTRRVRTSVARSEIVQVGFVLWRASSAIYDNFVALGGEMELISREARNNLAFACLFVRLFIVLCC
jgi:hypothetical protein